ncbi:MAG: hypothetical protein ACOVNR_09455 [Chitinophagaceae bacterium]
MSFTNEQLPAFVLADMYANCLVITSDIKKTVFSSQQTVEPSSEQKQTETLSVKPITPTTTEKPNWYLGACHKNIVIAVYDDSAAFVRDEWLQTLTKLLAALKMNLNDIALINMAQPLQQANLIANLQPKVVLLMGVSTTQMQLPFVMPHYQIQPFKGCNYLTAPVITLSQSQKSDEVKLEKSRLWIALKNLFLS